MLKQNKTPNGKLDYLRGPWDLLEPLRASSGGLSPPSGHFASQSSDDVSKHEKYDPEYIHISTKAVSTWSSEQNSAEPSIIPRK